MGEQGRAASGRWWRYALVAIVVVAVGAALAARSCVTAPTPQPHLDAQALRPESPAVSGRYAAWTDRTARGPTAVTLYDGASGSKRIVTPAGIACSQPALTGETLVYVASGSDPGDLYRYDIRTATARPFVVAPGRQGSPSADGDWVVWEDDRTGYGPRIRARRLSGGGEVLVPTGKPGAVQRRPEVGGGFVVFEEYDGALGEGDASIYGYDLGKGRLEAIATSPTVHLLPSTDGTEVAWCEQRGNDLDVVLLDRATGTRSSPPSACAERTTPAVSGGRLYWVQRCAKEHFDVYSWKPGEASATPLAPPGTADRLDVRVAEGSRMWLELRRHWYVRATLAGAASPPGAGSALAPAPSHAPPAAANDPAGLQRPTPAAAVPSPGRLFLTQAAAGLSPPQAPVASVSGPADVMVTWQPPSSTAGVAGYDVYRYTSPITSANIGAASKVASVAGPPAVVAAAPNEAAVAYTLYYAVAARDAAGNVALSDNTVPDPHGTAAGNTETCQRCHLGPNPGERAVCYGCHGDTPQTPAFGAGATYDAQAAFYDDTGTVEPASRHRNSYMTGTVHDCDGCHTPHRKPYDTDPAASFTMLLRTQLATATSGEQGFRYNTAAAPVGNQECFDCHGTNLTPIALVGGPTAYLNAGGDLETGWATSVHGTKVPAPSADPGIQCGACHDAHGSSAPALLGVFDTATGTNRIAGAPVTGNDSSVCLACHGSASAGWPLYSRDASGFPTGGTWPGGTVYASGIHAGATVVWPGTAYAGGACQNCHAMHGPSGPYDILRDTFSASSFRFCFDCHDGSPGVDVQRYYPPASGGTTTTPRAGHATVTTGTLAAGSALPCYDCHDPHGSASEFGLLVQTPLSATRTVAVGDAAGGISITATAGATAVRAFCLTCHTTADTANGWDGSAYVTVTAGALVEGIDRVSPDARLRLPASAGHDATDAESCYHCHGRDYTGAAGNVHMPGSGVVTTTPGATSTVPATSAPATLATPSP